jgi:membrane dipeptidase
MLRAVADNRGVVMINFSTLYLDPEKIPAWKVFSGWHWFTHPSGPETPLSMLVDHIDHLANVAGIDHVGLGSDFDGVPTLPEGLKDVGDFPNITVELVRRGYSDEDVRKVLGGNVLRVLDAVESVSAQAANRSNSDRPDTRGAR